MRLIQSLDEAIELQNGSVATVGVFDGVHQGHQQILNRVVERASSENRTGVAITFADHPLRLFRPEQCPPWMTDAEDKAALLDSLGIDVCVVLQFDWSIANRTAEEFCTEILTRRYGMRTLVCGPDFVMGKDRKGTVDVLRQIGKQFDFSIDVVDPVIRDGMPVSSTRVRDLLACGDVSAAAKLLGRSYQIKGDVVRGQGLGRKLGVPTINLSPPSGQLLPAHGVYAVRAALTTSGMCRRDVTWVPAVLNHGMRPTVDGRARAIEFHVIDGTVDSSPSTVRVEFVARLREERRFESLDSLKQQIDEDIRLAARHLDT